MRLRLTQSLFKSLLLALSLLAAPCTVMAGHMYDDLGFDLYRNLAENRGSFEAGATNVEVYDKHGNVVGTIPVVPDFGAMIPSHGGLAGGQSWVIDCVHAGSPGDFTFGTRQGAGGTPVLESYRTIYGVNAGAYNVLDLAVHRLSKVVTDVVHWEYTTDPQYTSSSSALQSLKDADVWRIGGGSHITYNDDGSVAEYHQYGQATAGTITPNSYQTETNTVDNGRGESIKVTSSRLLGVPLAHVDRDENIVPNNGNSGDSGTSVIFYNKETKSFQFIGVHTASTQSKDAFSTPYMDYSHEFFDHVINGSAKLLDTRETSWSVTGADASGVVTLTGSLGGKSTIQALAQGKRGDTSTVGDLADNQEMWDSLDWVLANGNTTLEFTGDVNTGAGTMQFIRALGASSSDPSKYTLSSTESHVNLQTAGYIIEEHVEVTSTLTGRQGDEWRIVGENARLNDANEYEIYGGVFKLEGEGNNAVDLNLGVGVTVFLSREDGYAANNVQINTASTVILSDDKQINGNVEFGVSGGTLNLNGNDYARTSANLYVFDKDARIVNFAADGSNTFSYTKNSLDAVHEIKAAFYDGASTMAGSTSVMNLSFEATAGSNKNIHLSNHIRIAGDMTVTNADMLLSGYQLELANPDMHVTNSNYRPALDPNGWVGVTMQMSDIKVSSASSLTLGRQVSVVSDTLTVDSSSSLVAEAHSSYSGQMTVAGEARFEQDSSISGKVIMQTGSTLNIAGGDHTMDLTIDKGASATLAGKTSITGSVNNAGTMTLSDQLAFSETISNLGTISFDDNTLLDISQLIGDGSASSYKIFSGGLAYNFTSLNSNNIIGKGTEEYLWSFQSDGSLVKTEVSRERWIDTGADFDVSSKTLSSGDSVKVIRNDASLMLHESMSVGRFFVDGVKATLDSNGYQLDVERVLISSGGTLELLGDAISADTRFMQLNGATDTTVILDMEKGSISDKGWLDVYTGHVRLRNGTFVQGDKDYHYESLYLEESGIFALQGVDRVETAFLGDGIVRADGVASVTFSQLADFTGHLETDASSIVIEGRSQAQVALASGDTLTLAHEAHSSGAITGTGKVFVQEDHTAQLGGIESFQGSLDVDGHLKLSGAADLSSIDLTEGATLELLDGVEISASSATRWTTRYNVLLGEGAHLNESSTQLMLNGGEVHLGGSGTYSVKGLTLSRGNSAGSFYVDDDATLHILGTSTTGGLEGMASFQLSATNHRNFLHISGTLISEAALVDQDGRAEITVHEGGTLELKQGGTYIRESAMAPSTITVNDQGTLLLGNQSDKTDYGSLLSVTMADGSRIGGSGTGDVTIYHTLKVAQAGAEVHFLTQQGQTLTMASSLADLHANVEGEGRLQVLDVGAAKNFSVSAAELQFEQSAVALDRLAVQSQVSLMASTSASSLTTELLEISHQAASLQVDRTISQLHLGVASNTITLGNKGNMRISATTSSPATLNRSQISNAHVENASLSDLRLVTLSSSQFSHSDISKSALTVAKGESQIHESHIDAYSSFELADGASLLFEETHFDGWNSATIIAGRDFSTKLKDAVTLKNSSLTVLPSSSYSLTEHTVYGIQGLDELTSEATIEGLLYLDVVGMDLETMMENGETFSFDFADLDFDENAALLNQLALRSNGYTLALSSGVQLSGSEVAYNVIPEPSTATLGLLALAGLLARRRRR